MARELFDGSRLETLPAIQWLCPQCFGIGGTWNGCTDLEPCICRGHGKVWRAKGSAWIRPIGSRVSDSMFWGSERWYD